jgi:hypothetical protein
VAYRSSANNAFSGDTNGLSDLFVYDQTTGATALVTSGQNSSLAADGRSSPAYFSSDSQTLFFQSYAADLTSHDFNQTEDIFAYNLPAMVSPGISNLLSGFSGTLSNTGGSGTSSGGGPGPALTWPVVPGKTYVVQFKDSLSDPAWQPLNGSVTVIGTNGYAFDLAPSPDRRFYRIVLSN